MIKKQSTTKKNQGYFLALIISLFLVSVFSSCLKDQNEDIGEPEVATVKFIHSLSGVSSLDFYVGNQRATFEALQFSESTPYLGIFAGNASMFVVLGGTLQAVARRDANLEKDKNYSLFATHSSAAGDTVSTIFTEDDLSVPSAGKAKIRFINLSRNVPAALDLSSSNTTSAYFTNRSFKTSTEFIEIDPAAYTFQIKDTGTSTVRASRDFTIVAGRIYSVWSSGSVSGAGTDALAIQVTTN